MDRRTFLRRGLAAAAGAGLLIRSEPADGAPAQPWAGPYGSIERSDTPVNAGLGIWPDRQLGVRRPVGFVFCIISPALGYNASRLR